MRVLNLNAAGRFWSLPRRSEGDPACSPEAPSACDFNRQDWAVLLQLKPQDALAKLGPVEAPRWLPSPPVQQACCVNCVVGSGVPRCPSAGGQPLPTAPDAED